MSASNSVSPPCTPQKKRTADMAGVDLGEMMMKVDRKETFECWKDVRVVEVSRCGVYIMFRKGDKSVVDAICHEEQGNGEPRFKKMMTVTPPLEDEGWNTTLVWKYIKGGLSAEELAEVLQRQPELKEWRVKAMEKEQPMTFLFSDSKLAMLVKNCDLHQVDRPTDEEAFGADTERSIEKLMDWHSRVITGRAQKKQKVARGF